MLAGQQFVATAVQRHEQLKQVRDLKGFAIFQRYEYSSDHQTEHLTYFFSPVAAQACADILAAYHSEPCAVPNRDEPDTLNFTLMFGTLESSESWDLLK